MNWVMNAHSQGNDFARSGFHQLKGAIMRKYVATAFLFVFAADNRDLGLPNDEPTKAVFQFLDGLLKGR